MTTTDHPLTNSRRRFQKLSYTPLVLPPPNQDQPTNVPWLATQVRALEISDAELSQLQQRVQNDQGQRDALDAAQRLLTAVSGPQVLAAAADLARVRTAGLVGLASALADVRSRAGEDLAQGLRQLDARFLAATTSGPTDSAPATPGSPVASRPPAATEPGAPGPVNRSLDAVQRVAVIGAEAPDPSRLTALRVPTAHLPTASVPANLARLSVGGLAATSDRPLTRSGPWLSSALGPAAAGRATAALTWAASHDPQHLAGLMRSAATLGLASRGVDAPLVALDRLNRLRLLTVLFADALTRRPLQPLGLLHLERLVMTPLEVERGELLYSLPLAPQEKVTLAHREWSVREEQFAEFVEDYMENFSERGVAESDDIAMSTSTQTSHSNALSMGQPVASANGATITGAVDATGAASSSVNATTSKDESREHSRTVTALASARTIKDHKVSFTVTTVAGIEDFTAHLIENTHADKSMRVDYFRRVRKWQSELHRYGVRLTYDVVVPDPGARLRSRQLELQRIERELATEFHLDLLASGISVWNWTGLADTYGVQLPAPPEQHGRVEVSKTIDYPPAEEVTIHGTVHTRQRIEELALDIPRDVRVTQLTALVDVSTWHVTFQSRWLSVVGDGGGASFNADVNGYITGSVPFDTSQLPDSGTIRVQFWSQYVSSGTIRLVGTLEPTDDAMEAWRLQCWTVIRDAAYAAYAQHRSYLRDRQSALQRDIAADDALRLRRMEREQIMRGVLEWLFPGFDDASSFLATLPSPGELDPGSWQHVMEYGEYIKFVQTAIDWDNVMVFLYPYFWDTVWHQQDKLFLTHPDPIHREFLRAGAARIVLAIQPGFEAEVVALLDQGQLGKLADGSRFAQVIKDVQDANASYLQASRATAPGEPLPEPGVLIGTWTDYTPSSALDVETTLLPVMNA
jgi:hypothetical protein